VQQVSLDGGLANEQSLPDLAVSLAIRDKGQHL
jgi:hypothetical protein